MKPARFELFAADFDAPAGSGGVIELDELDPVEVPPAPPPPITPAALDAACAEARALGHEAGRGEAAAAREAERHALLAALLAGLHDADATIRAAVDEAGTGLARLVMAALSAAFPALCARHGGAELARFTREVTALLAAEARVVIRLHPTAQPALDEVLAELEPELRAAILVEPREAMATGDARIAWRHGMAVRDAASLRARVDAVLAPLGLAPDPVPIQPAAAAPTAPAARAVVAA